MASIEIDFFDMYFKLEKSLKQRYTPTVNYYFDELELDIKAESLEFKTMQAIYTLVGQYAANLGWTDGTYLKDADKRKEIIHIVHTMIELYEGLDFLLLNAKALGYAREEIEEVSLPDLGATL